MSCFYKYSTICNIIEKGGVSEKIIAEFARISPIAWVHIAFTGKYHFKKSTGVIDIVALAHEIEKHIKQYFWKDA